MIANATMLRERVTATGAAVNPDVLYTPDEAAYLLGFRSEKRKTNQNRLSEIDYSELPRVRVGPRGGKVMFLGRDVLAFIESRRATRKP